MLYKIIMHTYCPTKEEVFSDHVIEDTEAKAVKAVQVLADKAQEMDPSFQLTFNLETKGSIAENFVPATFSKWSQERLLMEPEKS